jgi:hypothetical protein
MVAVAFIGLGQLTLCYLLLLIVIFCYFFEGGRPGPVGKVDQAEPPPSEFRPCVSSAGARSQGATHVRVSDQHCGQLLCFFAAREHPKPGFRKKRGGGFELRQGA